MVKSKLDSYLGFAAKSRNLVTGYNTCILMMEKNKIKLLIIACDLSENTIEKMLRKCKKHNVNYRLFGTSEEFSKVTGNSNKGIYGITDSNFASVICSEIDKIQSKKKEVF
jgi:ribosomal protein L7Ae-like RNA K-turn-binding protein